MKYFETKRIPWTTFSPDEIYFTTNTLVKKFPTEINIVPKMNRTDIHNEYENKNGVFVILKEITSNRPTADIYFKPKCGRASLVYLSSIHFDWEWKQVNGNWKRFCTNPDSPLPDEKAYRFSLGGTTHSMEGKEFEELTYICLGVKDFMINRIVPLKGVARLKVA